MEDEAPETVAEVLAEEVEAAETCCAVCEARFLALNERIDVLTNQIAALEDYESDDDGENEGNNDGEPDDGDDAGIGDERPSTTHWLFRRRSFFG